MTHEHAVLASEELYRFHLLCKQTFPQVSWGSVHTVIPTSFRSCPNVNTSDTPFLSKLLKVISCDFFSIFCLIFLHSICHCVFWYILISMYSLYLYNIGWTKIETLSFFYHCFQCLDNGYRIARHCEFNFLCLLDKFFFYVRSGILFCILCIN